MDVHLTTFGCWILTLMSSRYYSTEELCRLSHQLPPVNDDVCFSNSGLTTALREPLAVIVGGNEVDDRTFCSNSTN